MVDINNKTSMLSKTGFDLGSSRANLRLVSSKAYSNEIWERVYTWRKEGEKENRYQKLLSWFC